MSSQLFNSTQLQTSNYSYLSFSSIQIISSDSLNNFLVWIVSIPNIYLYQSCRFRGLLAEPAKLLIMLSLFQSVFCCCKSLLKQVQIVFREFKTLQLALFLPEAIMQQYPQALDSQETKVPKRDNLVSG